MAVTRRRRRKRVRYFCPPVGSSSESEKPKRRRQSRRSKLKSRAKRNQAVDEVSICSNSTEDDTSGDEEWETLEQKLQQQEHQKQEEQQEMPHSTVATPREEICGICLSAGGKKRGELDCCDHFFCFACIMKWSKVESRCPTCKERFFSVMRNAGDSIVRIPTRDQVYEPSEEEIWQFTDPYQNAVCRECQEDGDEGVLLLCDRCDGAAHTYCVGLARSVPRGDWFCHACQAIEIERSIREIESSTIAIESRTVEIESRTIEIESSIIEIENSTRKIESPTVDIGSSISS